MSSPGICRAYAAGRRCKYGTNCRYSHIRNPPGPSATRSSSPPMQQTSSSNRGRGASRGGGAGTPRGGAPNRSNDGVPHQTCRIFWNTGSCDRGFECQFKHTRNPEASIGRDSAPPVEVHDQAPDFASIQELAAITGTDTTTASPLGIFNVSQVHNHIKPFLKDNYTFESAPKMQSFIKVISSVNDQNKDWVKSFIDSIYARANTFLGL